MNDQAATDEGVVITIIAVVIGYVHFVPIDLCVANSYSESIPTNFARENLPLSRRKLRDSRTSGSVQKSENISPIRPSKSANILLPFVNRYRASAQQLSEVNLSKFMLSALLAELLVNCHRNQRKRSTSLAVKDIPISRD